MNIRLGTEIPNLRYVLRRCEWNPGETFRIVFYPLDTAAVTITPELQEKLDSGRERL